MSVHRFEPPLVRGRLVRRYKRFLADVELLDGPDGGRTITAHCMNTGSMMGLTEPGSEVWLTPHDNPKRKLQWTWELASEGEVLVGVNTQLPNRLVEAACREGTLPALAGYRSIRREQRYGEGSRIDVLLSDHPDDPRPVYVEVKNVTLARGDLGLFPDAVTARGLKHLVELARMVEEGARAVMIYLCQRSDVERLAPAADIDPAYAEGLAEALRGGVEVLPLRCTVQPVEVRIERVLPLAEDV